MAHFIEIIIAILFLPFLALIVLVGGPLMWFGNQFTKNETELSDQAVHDSWAYHRSN